MTDTDPRARDRQQDEWIAVRCQLGERAAFDELAERWHVPLWTYVRRMGADRDAAHDVVQDTWLRVLRGIPRLRDASALRPWLFGIARRVLIDRWRDKYASPPIGDADLSSIAGDEADLVLEADLAAMERELTSLPVAEREVLTLFYLEELPLADVAAVLGVPVGTVKSRLFRARRLLRHELLQKGLS